VDSIHLERSVDALNSQLNTRQAEISCIVPVLYPTHGASSAGLFHSPDKTVPKEHDTHSSFVDCSGNKIKLYRLDLPYNTLYFSSAVITKLFLVHTTPILHQCHESRQKPSWR